MKHDVPDNIDRVFWRGAYYGLREQETPLRLDDSPKPVAASWDQKALETARSISLLWGQDRSQFVSKIQVAVLDAMRWAKPQPLATVNGEDASDLFDAVHRGLFPQHVQHRESEDWRGLGLAHRAESGRLNSTAPGVVGAGPSEREKRLREALFRLDADGPMPGMAAAFENYFGQTWADPDWRNESSVWACAWRTCLAAAPQPAEHPDARQQWIDEACEAIKAADAKAMEGDYMLDSDDCIKVLRGELVPVPAAIAASAPASTENPPCAS